MDQFPPVANNEPTNPKPNHMGTLAFLKMGLFEFGFVAIILLLFFGILNYFNILSISSVFPNQLGWLPHQTIEQNAIPSPTNFTPVVFKYDTKKAEKLLTQYIKDTIKPEFLPSIINVRQKLLINNVLGESENQFGASFNTKDSTISATFSFNKNSNTPNDYIIFIRPPGIEKTTASLTNSLLSSYFTGPFTVSDCQTKEAGIYCENFQNLADGKRGYGMTTISFQGNTKTIVFNCFLSKNGTTYATQNSCINL